MRVFSSKNLIVTTFSIISISGSQLPSAWASDSSTNSSSESATTESHPGKEALAKVRKRLKKAKRAVKAQDHFAAYMLADSARRLSLNTTGIEGSINMEDNPKLMAKFQKASMNRNNISEKAADSMSENELAVAEALQHARTHRKRARAAMKAGDFEYARHYLGLMELNLDSALQKASEINPIPESVEHYLSKISQSMDRTAAAVSQAENEANTAAYASFISESVETDFEAEGVGYALPQVVRLPSSVQPQIGSSASSQTQ